MSSLVFRVLLPVILFISWSLGARYFIMGHFGRSGGTEALMNQCPPNTGPYDIRYVGIGFIDTIVCVFVAFYQSSFDATVLRFNADFLASLSGPIAFTFVEAARPGRSKLLAFPATMAVIYQIESTGFTFPLFWLTMILIGHTSLDRVTPRLDQAKAEAVLLALLAGYALPSVLMLTIQGPIITAVWFFLPVWMWLAQTTYLFIRPSPSSRYKPSDNWATQATFIFTFVTSALCHIAVIWPVRDFTSLKELFVPPIIAPDPATTSLQVAVHMTLQWDGVFALGSFLLGTLWFARDAKQVVLIALWNVIATVVVGPGAAVSGVLFWRERTLQGTREEISKKKW